jgi:hypothetical protein
LKKQLAVPNSEDEEIEKTQSLGDEEINEETQNDNGDNEVDEVYAVSTIKHGLICHRKNLRNTAMMVLLMPQLSLIKLGIYSPSFLIKLR